MTLINYNSFRRNKKLNFATTHNVSLRASSNKFLIDVYKRHYYIVSSEISALWSTLVAPSTREKHNN